MFSNEESIIMRSTNVVIPESFMDNVMEALASVFRKVHSTIVEILDSIGFKYSIRDDGGVELLFYSGCFASFSRFVDAVCPYVASGNNRETHMTCVDGFGETMSFMFRDGSWSTTSSGLMFQR